MVQPNMLAFNTNKIVCTIQYFNALLAIALRTYTSTMHKIIFEICRKLKQYIWNMKCFL